MKSVLWQRGMLRAQTVLSSHKTSTGCFGSCGTARETYPFASARLFLLACEIGESSEGIFRAQTVLALENSPLDCFRRCGTARETYPLSFWKAC